MSKYKHSREKIAKALRDTSEAQEKYLLESDPYMRGLKHGWADSLKFASELLKERK